MGIFNYKNFFIVYLFNFFLPVICPVGKTKYLVNSNFCSGFSGFIIGIPLITDV